MAISPRSALFYPALSSRPLSLANSPRSAAASEVCEVPADFFLGGYVAPQSWFIDDYLINIKHAENILHLCLVRSHCHRNSWILNLLFIKTNMFSIVVRAPHVLLTCQRELCWVLFSSSCIYTGEKFKLVGTDRVPMQISNLLAVVHKTQTDLLLLPPLAGTWLRFRSCAITGAWYWILTKLRLSLLVYDPRLWTLPMVTWSCLWFSFTQVPTLISLACSLTERLPSKTMCMVLFLVALKEVVFWGWWSVSLWAPLCYVVAVMHLFSQSLTIVLQCNGQLLSVAFYIPNSRCIRWPGVSLIRVFFRCVIDVMLLDNVCCTLCKVNSNSNDCLFSEFRLLLIEFNIPKLRPRDIHWS